MPTTKHRSFLIFKNDKLNKAQEGEMSTLAHETAELDKSTQQLKRTCKSLKQAVVIVLTQFVFLVVMAAFAAGVHIGRTQCP
jgi:lipopolysaccharide/colanic/teichoic acid biosynthesis glycosyltransferase